MFKKILIANRGEIACRIIRSAKSMGIATVAVYSEVDADAKHVEMADQAVNIGPPEATKSYLVAKKIIAAAKKTGAEAIHPGYGFLSENADFVRAVADASITFIGPPAEAIAAMGDKITSKKLAAKAGVITVPGYQGLITGTEHALEIATDIGYPVMIKATAGGGGKGMRIAMTQAEMEESISSARHEALASFGDDRIFIEKYIENPRHIEIQILADTHGNIIHLGERECSIQRRHQKVIEEAPSPFLDEDTRAAMGAQAVALARMVDYTSAGTVEFIADQKKNFYFLEMNTRLQVEHPVTEMVTGVDLVEAMIRIAAGEKLWLKQDDIKLEGSAIEARVYAEDPYRGFLPSIGRLKRYLPPETSEGVRLDDGVYEGAEISMYYDPMIAKLITHKPTRKEAILTMGLALDSYYIRGIAHNITFLSAVMASERFAKGELSTGFIAEEFGDGFEGAPLTEKIQTRLIATAAFLYGRDYARERRMLTPGAQAKGSGQKEWVVRLGGVETAVSYEADAKGARISLNGKSLSLQSDWVPGWSVFRGALDGTPFVVEIDRLAMGYKLTTSGVSETVVVLTLRQAELYHRMPVKVPADTSKFLLCPMPGLLVSVHVKAGEKVLAGQALVVVEAMKMENILRAEKDGRVAKIRVKAGASMAVDDVILEFE